MKKIKKVFIFLFILIFTSNAVAEQLYTLRSEHFEFIYPEESEETAILLFDNAENLYEKATSLLQKSSFLRLFPSSTEHTLTASTKRTQSQERKQLSAAHSIKQKQTNKKFFQSKKTVRLNSLFFVVNLCF